MVNTGIIQQINFRCNKELYDRLRYQVLKEERTQQEILNQALEEYLDKNEEGKQTKLVK